MKIKFKIVLPILFLIIIGISGLTLFSYITQYNNSIEYMKTTVGFELNDILKQFNSVDENIATVTQSYKDNYIILAKMVRNMIETGSVSLDYESLNSLCEKIGIDEIHIMDENGVLRWGNIKEFYGFDFNTSEQTKPFLEALTNKDFELAQDPAPRGVDGVMFQYIGVARTDKPGIIQIGMSPRGITELQKVFALQNILKNKTFGTTGYIYVIDDSGKALAHAIPERLSLDVSQESFIKEIDLVVGEKNG